MRRNGGARSSRAGRAAAAAALASLCACRTPAASTAPAGHGAACAQPAQSAPATVYVPTAPTILVASEGEQPFLLLDATVLRAGDGATFRLAYLAASDATAARGDEVPRRAVASAAVLLEAFAPVLAADVRAAELTAVFGRPGAWGAGVPVQLIRDAGRWAITGTGSAHAVLLPPLPDPVVRSIPGEEAAVGVARRFLDLAGAGDRDGAWALVSAAAKADLSRRRFEEDLGPVLGAGAPLPRRESFRQYPASSGDLGPGAVLDVCFEADGGVDRVQVRLDDDQEWRVVSLTHVGWATRPEASESAAVPLQRG